MLIIGKTQENISEVKSMIHSLSDNRKHTIILNTGEYLKDDEFNNVEHLAVSLITYSVLISDLIEENEKLKDRLEDLSVECLKG